LHVRAKDLRHRTGEPDSEALNAKLGATSIKIGTCPEGRKVEITFTSSKVPS